VARARETLHERLAHWRGRGFGTIEAIDLLVSEGLSEDEAFQLLGEMRERGDIISQGGRWTLAERTNGP
jgi:hypothetical protein